MTTKPQLTGLLLPSREALLWAGSDFGRLVDSAKAAEDAGYDSVWVGDSLLARPRGEPMTLLAAIAGVTKKVTLGTAILLPLLRNAITMAHQAATLDRISDGRLVLGIGSGADLPGTHAELAALNVPSQHRVTDMLALVERWRRLWRDEESGIDLQPRPVRPEGPPIWPAGNGPRVLRLAGEQFDGWIPFSATPEAYASALRGVNEAAKRAGRDPSSVAKGCYLTVAVAGHAEDATQQLDEYMRGYYGVPAEVMAKSQGLHAGTLESAAKWFASYRAAGAEHLVIRIARPSLDGYDETARQVLRSATATG
jgi:alkanesulfonate monooxygenase SsuD/methylene tetrahydromethanopterin reductase-like flavin-dependent oxidoreductase (luciferase family)